MKIIDSHAHIIGNVCGIGSEGVLRPLGKGMAEYESGKVINLFPSIYGDKTVTPETFLNVMDKYNVEYAILLQGNYIGFQNLYTFEAMKKYPTRFIASGTYDPFIVKKDKIITHLFDELNIKVIKMELSNTSGLMANHGYVDINGELLNEVYEMSSNHNLIFYIDIGRPTNICYQIDKLVEVVKKYKNMTFVICHLTAPQHDMKELLKENMHKLNLCNVYFDIAALPNNLKQEYPFIEAQELIKEAINIIGNKRILWGSDFPSAMNFTSYENSINYILDSKILTKEDKENIMYNNAKNLFSRIMK